MTSRPLGVAVLGTGSPADRIAAAVEAHDDLSLTAHLPLTGTPPTGTALVVLTPALAQDTEALASQLLREGYDVISTAPPESEDEIRRACAEGGRTFHTTGGFQSAVAARVMRSLAAAARDIQHVELVEEIAIPDHGLHPWKTLGDTGIGGTVEAARDATDAVAGWYTSGLRVLEEGGFGDRGDIDPVTTVTAEADAAGTVHTVTATHVLGDRVTYRSVRTAGTSAPRYRLVLTTAVGRSTATVEFHPRDGVHPADHLTARDVLDAIRPVYDSPSGIAVRDPAITYLAHDDRL